MQDLARRLMALGFEPDLDFIVQDDGDGPYIRTWSSTKAQPSEADLKAVTIAEPLPDLEPWRLRAALSIAGKEGAMEAGIAAMADPEARAVARAKLDYALIYQRRDPLFASLGSAIGLSAADLDALWARAAAL